MGKLASALLIVVVTGCLGAPGYQPPAVQVAPAYRSVSDTSPALARSAALVDTTATGTTRSPGDASVAPDSASPGIADRDRGRVVAEAPDASFWASLGDSTLVALVREALRANPDVHAAESRLYAARSSRRLSTLDLAPVVTANASVARQQFSTAQFPGVTGTLPQQDVWDAQFDASWEVDIFGRIGRTVRAGRALEASAVEDVHDAQLSLAAEVARTYFEMRGAQSELDVANRNAENQRRTVALTEQRLAAGSGTAFDVERARAELNLTLATTPSIEARVTASRNQLATLLGRSPEALPASVLGSADLPPLPEVVRVGSPEGLVRRRPDVVSAERQLAAQSMLVGAAKADYLPRLTLSASAGYTAMRFDALGNPGTPHYFVGPVLSWPFLDLGRVKTRVDIARAHADEARARYSSVVLGAIAETETAVAVYDRARERLANLSEAVRASTHALELAQLRYESGATDFLQVLDAQRTLLGAESALATGRTAAATALVAVYKAVGGPVPTR